MGQRRVPNWIEGYLAYTDDSESPEEYHKWVAISAIAGAIRRKAFFHMGYFLLYPNMYIVLVGPAGRCKKSTAMRIGRQFLSEVQGLNFTTDSTTREQLIVDLTQSHRDGHSSMSAFSSEFATMLTSSGMDMVVFLTDIFDSPNEWIHKTKSGGTNKIKAPYLNLIGATTPDWIAKAMPLDTVGIGLTSRIVFVFHDTPRVRPAFPELSAAQQQLAPLLVEDLVAISQISGQYHFVGGAKELYEEWYVGRVANPNPTGDPRLSGYYERKPVHLIKLAMIVSAAQRDETIITPGDVKTAMALFDEIEGRMTRVFANVGKNPLAQDYDDVAMAIAKAGGLTKGDLLRRFKHSLNGGDMDDVLATLVNMGLVKPAGNKFVAREE